MVYLDDTVVQSALGGILLALAAIWLCWGVAWLRRIELRGDAERVVGALGLALLPEGFGPSLRAAGSVDGVAVEIRWRQGFGAAEARVRLARTTWEEAPLEGLEAWTRDRVSARRSAAPG